ncbi:response regulator [Brevundimonas sp.]|uniref:response regulator n=1 Tax=Brevundimonas sp. TaxID=1871086 RepID=UPI00286A5E96|nr:response regulator [Brevundimonas sp.]
MQSSSMPVEDTHLASPRVLVVEDEFLIRMLVADHLRDAGFTVVEAFNGDEAIAILTSGVPIDLVFTDVRMPGAADGLELLAFVKRTRPGLPVLMTSGHLEPELAYAGGAQRFLSKPCDPDLIVNAIQAALETPA